MNRFVLDASAGVELLLDTTRGRALSARLPADAEWWVPEHYYLEVASTLRRGVLSQALTAAQANDALQMLERSVFRRAEVRPLLSEAWQRRDSMTIADALYVVLASHLDATLVTADERLSRAPTLDVPTIVP
ncbi:MAG TPA: type II toxin-antitoxin system VapC family toxin [Ilumatobacter sp.]|nr:type II toxin-antitoxin system VapC family toxin [Ilumatobacter sp.]